MKVLVTGATGFVGACLTRRLVMAGYDVHIFTRKQSNRWRILDILNLLDEHEVDLRDFATLQKKVTDIKPNIIYHLATYGGFVFQQDTRSIIESNFIGTVNLLRACEKVGFDYFVNTGSSSEYGFKQNPMSEMDIPEPVGDYGISKCAATFFCQSEAIQKRLPIVTLRLFSPYGYWDDSKRLIPYVIKSVLRGNPPKLSTPNSVRDYIFIEDILDFYQKIVTRKSSIGGIFNIGSGCQHSIGEVVSLITKFIGNNVKPIWGEFKHQRSEPTTWVADITKSKKEGLELKVPLQVGLEKTIIWIKDNLDLYP